MRNIEIWSKVFDLFMIVDDIYEDLKLNRNRNQNRAMGIIFL